MNRSLAMTLVGAALACASACQTYDFEPVVPLAVAQTTQVRNVIARQFKPNMMILLDKSGSMAGPINPADTNCPAASCPGPSCPAACPTRISELRNAMGQFLTQNGPVARMGLTAYPTDNTCGAPNAVRIDISQSNDVDSELQAQANQINQQIQGIGVTAQCNANSVCGGTPTGPSLTYLGTYAPLQDPGRPNFVLLLTDGLPNCNPANPSNCTNPTACRCTTTSCGTDTTAPFCTLGCLDQGGAVSAVTDLRSKTIRTIVVGFGSDFAGGSAQDVLNAMAEAGGFARACPNGTNAECGSNNTCDPGTKLCQRKFYQATNGAELAQALTEITKLITEPPCEYQLDTVPEKPEYLAVIVDGQNIPRGPTTWTYTEAGTIAKVTFVPGSQLCNRLESATPQNPVKVEIRIVETL